MFYIGIMCSCTLVEMTHHKFIEECVYYMMASSNGSIFRVAGPLCGEFVGRRPSPLTKASDAELWCFLWSATEQTFQ